MAFLIRTIDFTSSGREIVRDRTHDRADLTIGRAAENDIHLPDLAVEQYHVRVHEAPDETLIFEAVGTLGFGINGRSETQAEIAPDLGAELELGSSRLTFERSDDGRVQITIKQVETGGDKDALLGFALASALPSKRIMSWVFAGVILIALLTIPVVTHLTRDPVENDPEVEIQGQTVFDSTWSTGELSMAHHQLEENCEACHVVPFQSVQDATCLTCHEEIDNHAEMPRQAQGMPPFSRGDAIQWQIAETFGKEGPLGCVACHTEHEGPVKLEASTEQFCADCHDTMDTRLTDTELGNAHDFGKKHPQFRPAFYTKLSAEDPVRVSLDDNPVEMSGLKFPHDIHVDTQGGVARMAISLAKYSGPLECSDCHEATEDEIGFKPVVMEDSCESCHSLVAGRSGSGFTSLRHGDIDDFREDIAKVNLRSRPRVVTGRSRPGQFAEGQRYYSNFGRPSGAYLSITNALGPNGVCGECHLPTTTNGMPDVMPVNLPDDFLGHGHFDHKAHGDDVAECSDCHATETSKEATDLLIPDLASCRDCHRGESAVKTKKIVPSGCATCHAYHTPAKPWAPEPEEDKGSAALAAILERIKR